MDLLIARKGTLQLALNVALTGADCAVLDPDPLSSVTARIYREDPVTGTPALDPAMGIAGVVTLVELFTLSGFYGASLPISSALFERYTIWVQWISGGIARRKIVRLFISEDLRTINQGAVTTPSSRDTLLAST
jgi:hypothetical protein